MPPTKNTKNTKNTKAKSTESQEEIVIDENTVNETVQNTDNDTVKDTKGVTTDEKEVKKEEPGRTILVSPPEKSSLTLSSFKGLKGLEDTFQIPNKKSFFLIFKEVKDSEAAYNSIIASNPDLSSSKNIKYATYKSFFKINGLQDDSDYGEVKADHTKLISKAVGSSVLYYKLYRKDGHYVGCGDLTLDTKAGLDKLLHEDAIKNITFGSFKVTHYPYNNDKKKTPFKSKSKDGESAYA
jgi:hypothetical protein